MILFNTFFDELFNWIELSRMFDKALIFAKKREFPTDLLKALIFKVFILWLCRKFEKNFLWQKLSSVPKIKTKSNFLHPKRLEININFLFLIYLLILKWNFNGKTVSIFYLFCARRTVSIWKALMFAFTKDKAFGAKKVPSEFRLLGSATLSS